MAKRRQALAPGIRRSHRKSYGIVIHVVQRFFLECVPLGAMAETETRCLPDSKSSSGLVAVIPRTTPLVTGGRGMGKSMVAFFIPAEIS